MLSRYIPLALYRYIKTTFMVVKPLMERIKFIALFVCQKINGPRWVAIKIIIVVKSIPKGVKARDKLTNWYGTWIYDKGGFLWVVKPEEFLEVWLELRPRLHETGRMLIKMKIRADRLRVHTRPAYPLKF